MAVPVGPPLFFVESVATPELTDPDRHHAARVLRIRPGDPITVGDGRGSWRSCRFGPGLEVDGDTVTEAPVIAAVTVAFALTKSSKPEFVVQKLTEVGVDRIIGFGAARSVVRWDDEKSASRLERWRGVAREAAMQSRRAWIPDVDPVSSFEDLVGSRGSRPSPVPVMADLVGRPLSAADRYILVGPEGGWSDDERASGVEAVNFGPHVLRAETAAVIAGGLAVALRDGLVGP